MPLCALNSASFDFILPELYVEPTVSAVKHQHMWSLNDFVTELNVTKSIALIGLPGTGKTTILANLFLESKSASQFRFYFTAKDLVSVYTKRTSLNSIFKKLYNLDVVSYINEHDSNVFFIDGLDEIRNEDIDHLFEILQVFKNNNISFWISTRTDFYYRHMITDSKKMALFYDVLLLEEWSIEQSMEFVKNFSKKASKNFIFTRVKELLDNGANIEGFLRNPFKVSLLIFLLSDESYGIDRITANDFVLYREFYHQWLTQEKNRGTSLNEAIDILSFHTEIATSLYTNRESNELTNIISPEVLKKYNLMNDSAFIGLLQYKERLTQVLVEKFYHETLMEFLVGYGIIRSFLSGDNIVKYLDSVYNYGVNYFVRSAFENLGTKDKKIILNNLNNAYFSILKEQKDNEYWQKIREQIIYYVGRIPFEQYPEILKYAYYNESNTILNRAAALSLILFGDEDIEHDYLGKLVIGSPHDLENRSIQLVYFGDVQADLHKYRDDGIVMWERTKNAIIDRLSKTTRRDLNLRMWDIVTLYSFCVNRGTNILSDDDKIVIQDMIIEHISISTKRRERLIEEKKKLLQYIEKGSL